MGKSLQNFGGDWTAEKLERVRKYLAAYAKIMARQPFRFAYIDAFAGTGYVTTKDKDERAMLEGFRDKDSKDFLEGSARVALSIEPRFDKYLFVEKVASRFSELERLKSEFPALSDKMVFVNADANSYLLELCQNHNWKGHRAVLFLDPYGMEVRWETIKAIGATKAIDLWLLFPMGVAVNRLLKKDGKINAKLRKKLDEMFGTKDWYEAFYREKEATDLFGPTTVVEKTANFDSMGRYFVDRLSTAFAGVAKNPLPLTNSRKNPLYLLCFASGNPKGAKTAIRIAQDILGA